MTDITRMGLFGRGKTAPAICAPAIRTLIKNAGVITMDAAYTELPETDVLLDNGKIAAIGKNLPADGAEVIDASGMILAPGFVDGHRHVWETILAGQMVKTSKAFKTYVQYINQKAAICMRPDDVYQANLIGALAAIDSGVTTILDHANIVHTPEKGDAAARGLKDSGIAGVFCYQLSHTPTYGPGASVSAAKAAAEFEAPADDWHFAHAAKIKAQYFSDAAAPLQFGVGLSHVSSKDIKIVQREFARARALAPKLMTQHGQTIAYLQNAKLLGPDFHLCHGNGLTEDELKMMAGAGAKMCSSTMSEFTYDLPSAHARARRAGVAIGIGADVPLALTIDYYEHVRSAFFGLFRSPVGFEIAKSYTARDILAYATSGGAKALGLGDVTGSIEVGKRADLVLTRTDRLTFPMLGNLTDRLVNFGVLDDIDSVWAAGVRRKAGGKMIGVDWAAHKKQVRATQAYVFEKAASISLT